MSELLKNQIFREIQYGNNFAYIFEDNNHFVDSDYKVLQSQANENFISCMKMLNNGQIELFYYVHDFKTLSSVLSRINVDKFLMIIINFLENMLEVRNNGFLSYENIATAWNKILFDINTFKVKLVYLPKTQKSFEDFFEFENDFRIRLIELLKESFPLEKNKVEKIINDLANSLLSVDEVYAKIKAMNFETSGLEGSTESNNLTYGFRLISMDLSDQFEIQMIKDELIIGKSADKVDVVVPYNRLISRIHCKINKINEKYYIVDLGSSNGTYVNSVQLSPNLPFEVKDGDVIRLANSNFQIVNIRKAQ